MGPAALDRLRVALRSASLRRLHELFAPAPPSRRCRHRFRRTDFSSGLIDLLEERTLLSAVAAADTTPPTAVVTAANVTAAGATSYTFAVEYSDDVAIDVSTIGDYDVFVSGPDGMDFLTSLVSVDIRTDGTPRTATYSMRPPGGAWTVSDSGTYTIKMAFTTVSDTSGKSVPSGPLATFQVDVPDLEPPSATVSTAPVTLGGLGTRGIDVIYSDDGEIDAHTIDPSDLVITGPNGFIGVPASVTVAGSVYGIPTSPRTATYQIAAPGGAWDASDNGTYAVSTKAHEVFDTTQGSGGLVTADREKAVAAGVIGTFDVNITPGNTFQANDTTAHDQYSPVVARDAAGNSVVVWRSQNREFNSTEILGQRFDADGNPLGPEFMISDRASIAGPSVAMNADGEFVVAWYRYESGRSGIYALRFDSLGNPVSEELRLTDSDTQRGPTIAIDAAGNFIVVWLEEAPEGNGTASLGTTAWNVFAQRVSRDGIPQGESFRVNTSPVRGQAQNLQVSVVTAPSGEFMVAWDSYQLIGGGGGLFARRYDAEGEPQTNEFRVNDSPVGSFALAMNEAGASVIVWSDGGIYAQAYDSTGLRSGGPAKVSSRIGAAPASVAIDQAGNYLVTWTASLPNDDGCNVNDPTGVFAQWFSAAGRAHGSPLLVAGSNVGDAPATAFGPAIAATPEGAAVVVWAQKDYDRRTGTCANGGTIIYFDELDTDDTDILVRQFAPVFSPDDFYVAAADAGGRPYVRLFDAATGLERRGFDAYAPSFTGGVRVAVGDVDGDGMPDMITAPGSGGGPQVRIFSGIDGRELQRFWAYDPRFRGGVYVAVADVNGDDRPEIITGAGAGGGPHVRVFDGATGALLAEFLAYDRSFRGGVRVATGDVDGDGVPEIITGAGPGGGPAVRVFDALTGAQIGETIFAFDRAFRGGLFVAAGDLNGIGSDEIVAGAGAGGGPAVRVFDPESGAQLGESFFAFDRRFRGGVSVAIGDSDGDGLTEIIVGAGPGGGPAVRSFDPNTHVPIGDTRFAYPVAFRGGVFVAGRPPLLPDEGPALRLEALVAPAQPDSTTEITDDQLAPIVTAAHHRLAELGLPGDRLAQLATVQFIVADLGQDLLGVWRSGRILLDDDAAGAGWFVDYSPLLDEEFFGDAPVLTATGAGPAAGGVDLFTVVLHELGHALGLDHAGGVMEETLTDGIRRLATTADLDALFAAEDLLSPSLG